MVASRDGDVTRNLRNDDGERRTTDNAVEESSNGVHHCVHVD
jgi:hypothetical protein